MLVSLGPRWLNLSMLSRLDKAEPTGKRLTCPAVWHVLTRWRFGRRELLGPSWWIELPAWRAK
jgi:hypothetical protein